MRPATLFAVFCLLALALVGCGGGGGGTAGLPGGLTYTTSWDGTRADPPAGSGNSQILNVLDASGVVVRTSVLNRSAGSSVNFETLTGGEYRLQAELYSLPDGNGTLLGSVEVPLTINGSAQVTTVVGAAVERVRVFPASAEVQVDRSKQLKALAFSADDRVVFTEEGAFAWQVLGGVATVNSDGLVTGTTVGAGSVRVTHTTSGKLGIAPLSVVPTSVTKSEWTVLVFLNAANDLYLFSGPNMNQMERVAGNSNVRFVVQWKQSQSIFGNSSFDGTRRYLVQPDTSSSVVSPVVQDMGQGIDMGSPDTLRQFIDWGVRNYPAKRFALVIWNHGSGWNRDATSRAVSYDDELGTVIQTWQLPQALQGYKFDILAWDASLMQMAEIAHEIKDHAFYVAGSEESPPGDGYPYDLVFKGFRDDPFASTASLSKGFVDGMLAYPPFATRKITQSVIETAKLPALATAVDALAAEMIAHRTEVLEAATLARDTAQSYSPSSLRYYRDLIDYVSILRNSGTVPQTVVDAAANVETAARSALVWEGHNANSPKSNGIAIDVTPGSKFSIFAPDYRRMKFAADTRWDEWLLVSP